MGFKPQIEVPIHLTFALPLYFSRGLIDRNKRKNPEPIPYLLTESDEIVEPKPVPNSVPLLRSLCKGKGILKQNEQGLVYLDIDNRFISMMLPYLKMARLVSPPYFHLLGEPEGAHTPVISTREILLKGVGSIEELGREISFEIDGLFSLKPQAWPEMEQVWFFQLRSEGLEAVRRSQLLPSTPGGHPFHIAVAVKPRVTYLGFSEPSPLMRINVGYLVA